MTTPRTRPTVAITWALATALVVAGCASAPTQTPPDAPEKQLESAAQTPDVDNSEPTQVDMASPELPDWTRDAPEPGTDAALAWEALMGPDGEYAALASYQAVIDEFGEVEPYASIKEAESRHADALTRQLERMGVDVPDNPYLGLIDPPADLESAAQAWADGEVANVELYDTLRDQATDERLIRVFDNLRRASAEQHLPAFELAAESGGTLDPDTMARFGG